MRLEAGCRRGVMFGAMLGLSVCLKSVGDVGLDMGGRRDVMFGAIFLVVSVVLALYFVQKFKKLAQQENE